MISSILTHMLSNFHENRAWICTRVYSTLHSKIGGRPTVQNPDFPDVVPDPWYTLLDYTRGAGVSVFGFLGTPPAIRLVVDGSPTGGVREVCQGISASCLPNKERPRKNYTEPMMFLSFYPPPIIPWFPTRVRGKHLEPEWSLIFGTAQLWMKRPWWPQCWTFRLWKPRT